MATDRKVLIVTYYWPPSGGSGVQRWLKFAKYLPSYGWQPHVFTPENPTFNIRDESLAADVPPEVKVVRFPIWEPYDVFFKVSRIFGGRKKAVKTVDLVNVANQSFFQRASQWIRGNFFLPDPRVFWVKPSVKFLERYLAEQRISIVITTGPPHSIHLIGQRLKKNNPQLTWIADFRDPWSEWGLLDSLKVGSYARGVHRRMERSVLTQADVVTTITPFYVRHFQRLSERPVQLLTNGFDGDDFVNLRIDRPPKFTIRHIGIVNEKCDPRPFILALGELLLEDREFAKNSRLEFIGEVNGAFRSFASAIPAVRNVLEFVPSVPHKELTKIYGSSSVLLLILTGYKDAEGYMPGKLFEYIATGLPVLGVGPLSGDAANLIRQAEAGAMFSESDTEGMKAMIKGLFHKWRNGETAARNRAESIYSRRNITGQLANLLDTSAMIV